MKKNKKKNRPVSSFTLHRRAKIIFYRLCTFSRGRKKRSTKEVSLLKEQGDKIFDQINTVARFPLPKRLLGRVGEFLMPVIDPA